VPQFSKFISKQRACKRACLHEDGCEKKEPKACKNCELRGIKGLWFHDSRHTAITNMRKAGVDISVIMAITGHKTMAMFKRYNRIDLGDGIEAIKKLDQYLSREPEKREVRKEERQEEKADYFTTLLHMSRSGHLPPPNLLKSWWRCRDLAGL